jgi:hypothetical protein
MFFKFTNLPLSIMGFRDTFISAVAGYPAPTDSDRRRRPDNRNLPREARPGQTRARLRTRANRATAPHSRNVKKEDDEELEEIERLAPLSEREIIDVTDEPISSSPGSVTWGQVNDGAQQSPSQQTTSRPNSSAPTSMPRRNDAATTGARSVHFSDKVLAFAASDHPRALYLGVFDLGESDESDQSFTQHLTPDSRDGMSQYGSSSSSSSRTNTSAQRGTSVHTDPQTSSYHTPMLDPSYHNGHTCSPSPFHPSHHCPYHPASTHPYAFAWAGPPWRPQLSNSLPRRQIIFTKPSISYFEQHQQQEQIWDYRDWRHAEESELMEGSCGCGCGCGWVGGLVRGFFEESNGREARFRHRLVRQSVRGMLHRDRVALDYSCA